MKLVVALISGALLSSAAVAQHEHGASTGGGNETTTETREAPAASANAQAEGTERLICRRFDNTSTRLRRERVCKTAAQWREFDRDN